tara:strand:- start:9159 stop:11045 length:1887 start_codon:yes stop_codon:yes gene_type:complete
MSYHTSGSMRSYGGGYGTIQIDLDNTSDLVRGTTYSYTLLSGGNLVSSATADNIDGYISLIDSNFTIPDKPPPFSVGSLIQIFNVETQAIVTVTTIKAIKAFRSEEDELDNTSSSVLSTSTTDTPSNRTTQVTKVYDGSNLRNFYGMETMPIVNFVNTVLKDIPVIQIDQLENDTIVNSYKLTTVKKMKKGGKKKKKKKKKFKLFKSSSAKNKGEDKNISSVKQNSIIEIVSGVTYNIMIDDPKNQLGRYWEISYIGLDNPNIVSTRMYEEEPIEEIPASLPDAYQNSNNQNGHPLLLSGRNCNNCVFFNEGNNCTKWNAVVRDYYWCASWQTMQPVIAQSNNFTPLINQTQNELDELYNFFLERVKDPISQEPNLSNFLTAFDPLHSIYNAYIYGDVLRRIVDAGNAFDFDSAPFDLFFPTQQNFLTAIDFINDGGLTEFEIPEEQYDSVQQHLCVYTLSKKENSSLPQEFPQQIVLNLHGTYFGQPINILSQLDFTNAKIAYNPKSNGDIKHILIDSRYGATEENGVLHVDLLRDNVRERILKLFADNSISYKLDGESSFKFIQWVGDRSYNSERMQALYQYMLTVEQLSQDDATLLELINESLSEQLIDNPSTVQLPLSGFGGEV